MSSPPPSNLPLSSSTDVVALLRRVWPEIVAECRAVWGSELHYQAMIYHILRQAGAPLGQIGMNVKQWIESPITEHFRALDVRKHESFRGGFEPIPDIVLFDAGIAGDFRRRNRALTLRHMIGAIEVKTSERQGGRLTQGEILRDIAKLVAHRKEADHRAEAERRGRRFLPVMLVLDTAPDAAERMRSAARQSCRTAAVEAGVGVAFCRSR